MTESTRVLHVIHGLPRGGLENGVVNLLNGLPEDIEQAVVCMDQRGAMAERIQRDIPISVLNRGRHDFGAIKRLAARMREFQPHVVHARNWNCWPDAVLAHRLAGRPGRLIWSFHGFPDGQENMPFTRRLASRLLAAATDQLVAVCRDAGERYARVSGVDPKRFAVLYNGVNTQRFKPDEALRQALRDKHGMPHDKLVVLTVASLTPVKCHQTLIDAAAIVRDQIERSVEYRFVGEGAQREALEAQVKALGLDGVVTLPGGSDQVPELLAAADLFVLPSRLEGMSNAIIEAMASGLPVIANAVGGNVELIDEGVSGMLSEPETPASMAAALVELLTDDELRLKLGRQARQRTESLFSIEAMMRNYAQCYRHGCDD